MTHKTIEGCLDCPFRDNQRGHGESFEYCGAPGAPDGYGNVLPELVRKNYRPDWCPLPAVVAAKGDSANAAYAQRTNMPDSAPMDENHPVMIAWKAYQQSDSYCMTPSWAKVPEHPDGSLCGLRSWRDGWPPMERRSDMPVEQRYSHFSRPVLPVYVRLECGLCGGEMRCRYPAHYQDAVRWVHVCSGCGAEHVDDKRYPRVELMDPDSGKRVGAVEVHEGINGDPLPAIIH